MARYGLAPDLVLSSPAVRARETAILMKEAAGLTDDIKHDERIYEASPQTLRQVATSIDDNFNSAMLVGHNPGMEGFVHLLTGRLETIPTAALAVIDRDIESWREIEPKSGKLRKLIRPKEEMKKFYKGG